MMMNEIKTRSSKMYSKVKDTSKNQHTNEIMIKTADFENYVRFEYTSLELELYTTISDEFVLKIAEVLYWCKWMCLSHPNIEEGKKELTDEIIYLGCLYHMQKGLSWNNYPLIPCFPHLAKRGYLVPPNMLSKLLTERRSISYGMSKVKLILFELCKIQPPHEVSYMDWKRKSSVLELMDVTNGWENIAKIRKIL